MYLGSLPHFCKLGLNVIGDGTFLLSRFIDEPSLEIRRHLTCLIFGTSRIETVYVRSVWAAPVFLNHFES